MPAPVIQMNPQMISQMAKLFDILHMQRNQIQDPAAMAWKKEWETNPTGVNSQREMANYYATRLNNWLDWYTNKNGHTLYTALNNNTGANDAGGILDQVYKAAGLGDDYDRQGQSAGVLANYFKQLMGGAQAYNPTLPTNPSRPRRPRPGAGQVTTPAPTGGQTKPPGTTTGTNGGFTRNANPTLPPGTPPGTPPPTPRDPNIPANPLNPGAGGLKTGQVPPPNGNPLYRPPNPTPRRPIRQSRGF